MGAAIGSNFEELKAIIDGVPEVPLGICVDTAHAFHAGYGIHTEAGLEQTIAALDRTVGLPRVAVLHVNDSKTPFASRVDRHEHIGRGKIGLEAFRRILNHPSLSAGAAAGRPGRAFLLETPIDAPGDDRRNVRRLWDLVGIAAKQAPRAQNGFSMMRAKPRLDGADASQG
jgi:deoxyribonuclease-4